MHIFFSKIDSRRMQIVLKTDVYGPRGSSEHDVRANVNKNVQNNQINEVISVKIFHKKYKKNTGPSHTLHRCSVRGSRGWTTDSESVGV